MKKPNDKGEITFPGAIVILLILAFFVWLTTVAAPLIVPVIEMSFSLLGLIFIAFLFIAVFAWILDAIFS